MQRHTAFGYSPMYYDMKALFKQKSERIILIILR